MNSSAWSVENSHKAFGQLLEVVKLATNNDSEVIRGLLQKFNKSSSAYRVSSEFHLLLQDTRIAIEQDFKTVHKSLLKLVNELKAYSAKTSSCKNTAISKEVKVYECAVQEVDSGTAIKPIKRELTNDNPNANVKRARLISVPVTEEKKTADFPDSKSIAYTEVQELSSEKLSNGNKQVSNVKEANSDSSKELLTIQPADSEQIQQAIPDVSLAQREKRENQIHRLEILLVKIDKEIKKLQECELSFSDMEDGGSAYVMEDRYKKKFVKVWETLCKLKGRECSTGRYTEQKFSYSGCRYHEINRKIEKLLAKTKSFPDFQDVYELVQRCNEKFSYKLGKSALEKLARDVFVDVGTILQKRRKKDLQADFGCFLTDQEINKNEDPAVTDSQLKQQLMSNQLIGNKNLEQVIEKYAQKQEVEGDEENLDSDKELESEETVDEMDEELEEPSTEQHAEQEELSTEQHANGNVHSVKTTDKKMAILDNHINDTIVLVDSQETDVNSSINHRSIVQYSPLPDLVTDNVPQSHVSEVVSNRQCNDFEKKRLADIDKSDEFYFSRQRNINPQKQTVRLRDTTVRLEEGTTCSSMGPVTNLLTIGSRLEAEVDDSDIIEIGQSAEEQNDYKQFMLRLSNNATINLQTVNYKFAFDVDLVNNQGISNTREGNERIVDNESAKNFVVIDSD